MSNDDSYNQYAEQEARRQKRAAELRVSTRAALFDALEAAGIASVTVSFDGEGDSGQIEDISAYSSSCSPMKIPAGKIAIPTPKQDGSGTEETKQRIREVIEELCYDLLTDDYACWQDNDGSFGEFEFNVARRTIGLTFNSRYSDYDTSTATY
jgi:hypothetical protein